MERRIHIGLNRRCIRQIGESRVRVMSIDVSGGVIHGFGLDVKWFIQQAGNHNTSTHHCT